MSWSENDICRIAAQVELSNKSSMYVNLGIGMPTMIPAYIPKTSNVVLHSENGLLGIGEFPMHGQEDPDLINAGKQTITTNIGASFFDSADSFAMIRGAHIDLCILGAFQVSCYGDLANWSIPNKLIKGMGGAMDLVANVKRVVVVMEHLSKDGKPKIMQKCSYPLTGTRVVDRVITNIGVFDVDKNLGKLIVKAHPNNVSLDEIAKITPVSLEVALDDAIMLC